MHSAELNVPQNHVYLFKPQAEKLPMSQPIFAILSALCVGKASREVEHEDGKKKGLWI